MDAFNLTVAIWLLVILNKHYGEASDWRYTQGWKGSLAHLVVSLFVLTAIGFNIHYGLNG